MAASSSRWPIRPLPSPATAATGPPSPPARRSNIWPAVGVGELLTAEGQEQALGGRLGVYDITVRRGDGTVVALFRGRSYGLERTVFDEDRPA